MSASTNSFVSLSSFLLGLLEDVVRRGKTERAWMKHWERAIVCDMLRSLRPRNCLEWGTGYSTLNFPRYIDRSAPWYSVEHEQEWARLIQRKVQRPTTRVFHVPPNHHPWTDGNNDGSYDDLRRYVDFPSTLDTEFDFILIDGRARGSCIRRAKRLLSRDGVVLVHDAFRDYYRESMGLYEFQYLLLDRTVPCGLWFGSSSGRNLQPGKMGRYRRLWDLYIGLVNHRVMPSTRMMAKLRDALTR